MELNKSTINRIDGLIPLKGFKNKSFEIYKQRAFLDEVVEETLFFNKSLNWDNNTENLFLTTTAEELFQAYQLRSEVYTQMDYQKEFPDLIPGLNFDKFDKTSAIVCYKQNDVLAGTCRLIFDSENKLPSEEKCSFHDQRKSYNKIAEISRNMVRDRDKGLNLTFKYLMRSMYYLTVLNDIDLTLFGIKSNDLKLFSKFGGIKIIKELDSYGAVNDHALIISRESKKTSAFFKKVFL